MQMGEVLEESAALRCSGSFFLPIQTKPNNNKAHAALSARFHIESPNLSIQMGDVLEESARIALSWIHAHASQLPLLPPGACNAAEAATEAGSSRVLDGVEHMQAGRTAAAAAAAEPDSTCWDVHLHMPAGAVPKAST